MAAPNANPLTTTTRAVGFDLCATASAPKSAPTPIDTVIQLYVAALPSNVTLAMSGSTTGKLIASVPTTTVIVRIDRSSGVSRM